MLLSSRFRYADRRLLFARIRLFSDHLTLSGLSLAGIHRRRLALAAVEQISWTLNEPGRPNFCFHLKQGETLRIYLEAAGLWKYRLEALAPHLKHAPSRARRGSSQPSDVPPPASLEKPAA